MVVSTEQSKARFIEPMLLQRTESLPEGSKWAYEVKLDGYRALAIKANGRVQLRSRNNKDFNTKYPGITSALGTLPDETVIDGEIVAVDETGRPSFNALQNYGSPRIRIVYYVFDVLILSGRNIMSEHLAARRDLLRQQILPKVREPVRECPTLDGSLPDLIEAVRAHGLEGLVAKRLDSVYESGQRSGAWRKMRIDREQEFVIGGYTPASREQLYRRFQELASPQCPFANLPETEAGRWGQGLTAEKMRECRWLKPVLVGRFQYLEQTPDHHLRHARFVALRDDRNPGDVPRET